MFKDIYLTWTSHGNSLFPLCLSSLLLPYAESKNTLRSMYRKDKPRNMSLHRDTSYSSCACTPARLSSADPLNSRSIMMSGCWVNTARKWEVSCPSMCMLSCPAKGTKYSTWQGISSDYRHNRELKLLSFSDLMWPVVKSLWSLYRRSWVMSPSVLYEASVGALSWSVRLW